MALGSPVPTSPHRTLLRRCATVRGLEVQNQIGRSLWANLARICIVLDSGFSRYHAPWATRRSRVLCIRSARRARPVAARYLLQGIGCARCHWPHLVTLAPSAPPAPGDTGCGCSRTQWRRPAMFRGRWGEVRDLSLVRVETGGHRLVWNILMAQASARCGSVRGSSGASSGRLRARLHVPDGVRGLGVPAQRPRCASCTNRKMFQNMTESNKSYSTFRQIQICYISLDIMIAAFAHFLGGNLLVVNSQTSFFRRGVSWQTGCSYPMMIRNQENQIALVRSC